jgi:hypothetical protein
MSDAMEAVQLQLWPAQEKAIRQTAARRFCGAGGPPAW